MKQILRYFLLFGVFSFAVETALAQAQAVKERHQVKRKETIFGIAREYGLTVQELISANPEMNAPGYELKKGDYINIPYPTGTGTKTKTLTGTGTSPTSAAVVGAHDATVGTTDMRQREIRIGVMLPLHDMNGDGKRMVEYYRGVLMACDSLRSSGISTDIRAWNVAEDTDIRQTLRDPHAADRDLIIGPLYSKQAKALGDFAREHGIRLLIPFSINTPEVQTNSSLYQVYQNGHSLNDAYSLCCYQRYIDCHPILIDCNDSTSTKGGFTAALRRRLEAGGIKYSITNLKSSESLFMKCFSTTQRNVVILNTSRSAELGVAFAKLNGLLIQHPNLQVVVFGYPEWLLYTRQYLDNFHQFDVCIPTTYYMDPLSPRTNRIKQKYHWNFRQDMQNYHQRFAVTGFDHAFFFVKGLHLYGDKFTGSQDMVGYTPFQTPLNFVQNGDGGWQNRSKLLVHYTKDHRVETIKF